MCLPQPESPPSRISLPREEEGCDRRPGCISIIQAGLLLTAACFTPSPLPNAQLWLLYCAIPRQGDTPHIHLASTRTLCIPRQPRSRLPLGQIVQTRLGVIAEVSDYRSARLSPPALTAGETLSFVAFRTLADGSTGSAYAIFYGPQ